MQITWVHSDLNRLQFVECVMYYEILRYFLRLKYLYVGPLAFFMRSFMVNTHKNIFIINVTYVFSL